MSGRPLLAAALLVAGSAAHARFAPPLGIVLRLTSTETRVQGPLTRHFSAERRLVFRRAGSGYVAELTLVAVHAEAEPAVAAMFAAGLAPLRGRTLHVELDAEGSVTGVADEDTIWVAVADAIAAAGGGARGAATRQLALPLRSMPEAARRVYLVGELAQAIAARDAEAPAGSSPVDIAATTPLGAPLTLHGRRTVTAAAALVRIETHADGTVALPAAPLSDQPGGTAQVRVDRVHRIDPATGLTIELRGVVDSRGEGGGDAGQVVTTGLSLVPVS